MHFEDCLWSMDSQRLMTVVDLNFLELYLLNQNLEQFENHAVQWR